MGPPAVHIREVGPRDGFQNEPEVVPTDDKVRLIDLLARTGAAAPGGHELRPARRAARSSPTPRRSSPRIDVPEGVAVSVLVPNERGLERALRVRDRFDEVSVFLSASETHNRHNVNRSVADSLDGLERVLPRARAAGLRCEAVIAVSFGCPYEGEVPADRVLELAARLAAAGAQEVGFGDTTGMANPRQVGAFFTRAARSWATRSS